MVTSLTETSNQTNKSFYTNVLVLLFITKLYLKKFKQFCLGELLKFGIFFGLILQKMYGHFFKFFLENHYTQSHAWSFYR